VPVLTEEDQLSPTAAVTENAIPCSVKRATLFSSSDGSTGQIAVCEFHKIREEGLWLIRCK
jgi:hypothetical protein